METKMRIFMNKLLGLFLLALAFLAPGVANAAACFWFGGTGNINDTSKWFLATGGTGGACTAAGGWPNSSSDNATFDGASGGGTITRNVAWTVSQLTIGAFTGTFGNTTDSAAVNVTFNFNNSGSGTRTINLGSSTWTVTNWLVSGATNLTQVPGTSTVVISGATSGNQSNFNPGTFSLNNVTFAASSVGGAISMNTGNVTFANLTINAPNYIWVNNGANITVSTALTFSGGGPNAWTGFATTAPSNNFTFTLSGGAATCNYCSFRDTTAATNGITATNSIDYGHNTNFTITPPSAGGSCPGRIIGGENKYQSPIRARGQLASVC
jgi:hypothetical protein